MNDKQLLKAAFEQLKDYRTKELLEKDEIAIVSMACTLPNGVNSPEMFWDALINEEDLVGEFPKDRWQADLEPKHEYSKFGGFIKDVKTFDNDFFSITPIEALTMDPQQRLMLELSWELFENSGKINEIKKDVNVGVFIGVSNNDYLEILRARKIDDRSIPYIATGNSLNSIAGRISHFYGFTGPTQVVDTACSSSLVALHNACLALKNGECSQAIVGGINLMLTPYNTMLTTTGQMMSPVGKCKTFDKSADGYVRSEGYGLILLKRKKEAVLDGNHILALIKASNVNHNGRSGGLTVPSGLAQSQIIKKTLANIKIVPQQINFIEAHGTGTALGDPIEVNAINDAIGQYRKQDNPLYITSAKSTLGHLEAAAGIVGIIKTILTLKNRVIPKNIHLQKLNENFDWKNSNILAVQESTPLVSDTQLLAGVSSFGYSGVNAHVILEEHKKSVTIPQQPILPILIVSAKTKDSLRALAYKYIQFIIENGSKGIETICQVTQTQRVHFMYRKALNASNIDMLLNQLNILAISDEIPSFSTLKEEEGISPMSIDDIIDAFNQGTFIKWSEDNVVLDNSFYKVPNYQFKKTVHWPEMANDKVELETNEFAMSELRETGSFSNDQLALIKKIIYRQEKQSKINSIFSIEQTKIELELQNDPMELTIITNLPALWQQCFKNTTVVNPCDHLALMDSSSLLSEKDLILYDLNHLSAEDFNEQFANLLSFLSNISLLSKNNRIKFFFICKDDDTDSIIDYAIRKSILDLSKVFNYELSNLDFASISIDSIENSKESLLNAIAHSARNETRFIIKNNTLSVIRLRNNLPSSKDFHVLKFNDVQLITGGFGVIGQHVTAFLIEKGATNILLNTRSLDDTKKQVLKKLEAQYPYVTFKAVEGCISNNATIEKISQTIKELNKPLKGIFHLAGVSEDVLIENINPRNIKNGFDPKIEGTKNLHLMTINSKLDYFVCFSSIASILGFVGQSTYSTANSFQNAIMEERRKQGLVGISVLWGSWKIGMTKLMDPKYVSFLKSNGVKLLGAERAFKNLEYILKHNLSNIIVTEIDTEVAQISPLGQDSIFNEIFESSKREGLSTNISQQLQKTNSLEEYRTVVKEYLIDCLIKIIGITSQEIVIEKPLIELGFDSLMTIKLNYQLQNDLNINITVSEVFEGITIQQILNNIELNQSSVSSKNTIIDQTEEMDIAQVYNDLDNLSEEDLDKLLQQLN